MHVPIVQVPGEEDLILRSHSVKPLHQFFVIMAGTLPSPPRSRSSSPSEHEDKSDKLSQELDGLLEQYLEFLDTYTKLRDELSQCLSAGFFSLAQAQRTSTLGAGRRYGQEYYDQRMRAQKLVEIEKKESHSVSFRVQKHPEIEHGRSSKTGTGDTQAVSENSERETTEISAQSLTNLSTSSNTTTSNPVQQRVKQDPALRDPLTWFGILAPSGLRQTQSNFVRATDEIIPALLTCDSDMKNLEDRIWAVRECLGWASGCENTAADTAGSSDTEDVGSAVADLNLEEVSKPSVPQIQKRSQRPGHSKSTLLKLGD